MHKEVSPYRRRHEIHVPHQDLMMIVLDGLSQLYPEVPHFASFEGNSGHYRFLVMDDRFGKPTAKVIWYETSD